MLALWPVNLICTDSMFITDAITGNGNTLIMSTGRASSLTENCQYQNFATPHKIRIPGSKVTHIEGAIYLATEHIWTLYAGVKTQQRLWCTTYLRQRPLPKSRRRKWKKLDREWWVIICPRSLSIRCSVTQSSNMKLCWNKSVSKTSRIRTKYEYVADPCLRLCLPQPSNNTREHKFNSFLP